MKKGVWISIAVMLIVISFSGCAPELHQRLLVKAVGIDLAEDGYRVTVSASAVEGNGGENSFSADGETVPGALEAIALQTGKKPMYAHTAVLVFGMDCAERGIEECLDFFLRHYDSKPTVKLCVSETTAEALLTVPESKAQTARAQQLMDLLQAAEFIGNTVNTDLIKLVNQNRATGCGTVLPVLRAEDSPVLSKAVVLQDMRLAAVLDASALRGYLLLSGELQTGETAVRTEECGTVSVSVNDARCDLRFSGSEEEPKFTLKVDVKGEISALSKGMRHLDHTVFPELERAYAMSLLKNIEEYLGTTMEKGADAVGLLAQIRADAPEIWSSVEKPEDLLKRAAFDIQLNTEIDRVEEEDTPYL